MRDRELHDIADRCLARHDRHTGWLLSRMTQEAPQAMIAAID